MVWVYSKPFTAVEYEILHIIQRKVVCPYDDYMGFSIRDPKLITKILDNGFYWKCEEAIYHIAVMITTQQLGSMHEFLKIGAGCAVPPVPVTETPFGKSVVRFTDGSYLFGEKLGPSFWIRGYAPGENGGFLKWIFNKK